MKINKIMSFDQLVLQTIGGLNDVEAIDAAIKSTSFEDVFVNVKYDPLAVAEQSVDLSSGYEIDPEIVSEMGRTDNPFGLANHFGSEDNNDIADSHAFSDVGDFVSNSFEERDPEAGNFSAATKNYTWHNNESADTGTTAAQNVRPAVVEQPEITTVEVPVNERGDLTLVLDPVEQHPIADPAEQTPEEAQEDDDSVNAVEDASPEIDNDTVRDTPTWVRGGGRGLRRHRREEPDQEDDFYDRPNQVVDLDFDKVAQGGRVVEEAEGIQLSGSHEEPVIAVAEVEDAGIEIIGVASIVADVELV